VQKLFTELYSPDFQYIHSGGCLGSIKFNPPKLSPEIPEYFHAQLDDLQSLTYWDKEPGARIIIAHYLTHAVKLARIQYNLQNLALYSKLELGEALIPYVGYVSGPLDFALSDIEIENEGSTQLFLTNL